MRRLRTDNFKQTVLTIKRSFLPASIFAAALMLFFAQNPFEFSFSLILHYLLLSFSVLGLIFLAVTNQAKPFFGLWFGLICYLLMNWLKRQTEVELPNNAQFLWLCFLAPLNFWAFYMLPTHKLFSKRSIYLIVAVLLEFAFIQHAGDIIEVIPYMNLSWQAMPLTAVFIWLIMFGVLLLVISFRNLYSDIGLFYAYCCVFFGFVYADTASGLSSFFLGFVLILTVTSLFDFYYRYHYDEIENVGSYASFLAHSNNKFAFKYSIGIFSINDRSHWCQELGWKKVQSLDQMIIRKIHEISEEYEIYRYNHEEYIIVFNNQNTKQARDNAESIRRTVAAADFVFASGQSVKITITIAVAEKTRKYMEGAVVAERAHESLQKSYKFNSNIVTITPN